jgi:hypothetical protein
MEDSELRVDMALDYLVATGKLERAGEPGYRIVERFAE